MAHLPGCPLSRIEPGRVEDLPERAPDVVRVELRAGGGGEHERVTGGRLTKQLPTKLERGNAALRHRQPSAGLPGLGITTHAHRAQHGDRRWLDGSGVRAPDEVHLAPVQRPQFLGACADQQCEHDVGV